MIHSTDLCVTRNCVQKMQAQFCRLNISKNMSVHCVLSVQGKYTGQTCVMPTREVLAVTESSMKSKLTASNIQISLQVEIQLKCLPLALLELK